MDQSMRNLNLFPTYFNVIDIDNHHFSIAILNVSLNAWIILTRISFSITALLIVSNHTVICFTDYSKVKLACQKSCLKSIQLDPVYDFQDKMNLIFILFLLLRATVFGKTWTETNSK